MSPRTPGTTLDLGARCPRCARGTIVLVSRYRRAPEEVYSDEELRGPIGREWTRYRCSQGCTWVERPKAPEERRQQRRRWTRPRKKP